MADPFDDIDIGADFEAFAVGQSPITVTQIDPDTGAALVTVTNVAATRLTHRRQPFGVGGGELPSDAGTFVFRADQLGFTPKTHDQITTESGQVWEITSARMEGFDALCNADVQLKR